MSPKNCIGAGIVAASLCAAAGAGVRDIQIVRVDFSTQVMTLQNVGVEPQALDGYRLCGSDDTNIAQYTGISGFNGITLQPDESLDIHFLDDSGGAPGTIDLVDLGASPLGYLAVPLDQTPYGMGLYWNAPTNIDFAFGENIADYVQWTNNPNVSAPGNLAADFRADEAVSGGTWTDIQDWVITTLNSERIDLDDLSGAELQDSSDYTVTEAAGEGADFNGDGMVNGADLATLLANWGDCPEGATCTGDLNGDGTVNGADLAELLANWGFA
jgi:hypothetical protein